MAMNCKRGRALGQHRSLYIGGISTDLTRCVWLSLTGKAARALQELHGRPYKNTLGVVLDGERSGLSFLEKIFFFLGDVLDL